MANYFSAITAAGVDTLIFNINRRRIGLLIGSAANVPINITFDGQDPTVFTGYAAMLGDQFVYIGSFCPTGEIRVATALAIRVEATELLDTDHAP